MADIHQLGAALNVHYWFYRYLSRDNEKDQRMFELIINAMAAWVNATNTMMRDMPCYGPDEASRLMEEARAYIINFDTNSLPTQLAYRVDAMLCEMRN
jgi:hypothetical protein